MKCHILFSRKNKKDILKCRLLKQYPACKVLSKQEVTTVVSIVKSGLKFTKQKFTKCISNPLNDLLMI